MGTRATEGVSPALVGRTDELETLVNAVSAPPAVVVIEGEAGIGKSRLVGELQRTALSSPRRVVTGRCRQIREPFPLGVVLDAARQLAAHLDVGALSPVAGSLQSLLPEMAAVLPEQPAALEDGAAERHRTFRGLAALWAAAGPTVLILEDLQWADDQTIEFLGYLLADPPPSLAIAITFRSEDVAPQVRAIAAKRAPHVRRTDLILERLDATNTGTLAAAILGLDRVSQSFAQYLRERSSGIPFAIEELLALMRARGTLVRRGGGWARRTLGELDVPTSIRDSVLERVSQQRPDVRAVLDAAAVLATPVTVPLLSQVAEIEDEAANDATEDAMAIGMLVEQDDAIAYRHVLATQAVYEAISAYRRRELHTRAAATLESGSSPPRGQVAYHLRQAGDNSRWIAAAEEAADVAIERGYEAEAVRLLEDILRHGPHGPGDVEQRSRVGVKLARAAIETTHGTYGIVDLLLALSDTQVDPQYRGELRFWLAGLIEHTGGDPRQERRLLVDAVAELNDQPHLKAWAMMALGMPIVSGDTRAERHRWLQRALDMLPQVHDPSFVVLLQGKIAMVLLSLGDSTWRSLVEEMVTGTDGMPDSRREANAYNSVGLEAVYTGHHETAGRLLDASLKAAVATDSRRLELQIRSGQALLDFSRGTWAGLGTALEPLLDELAEYAPGRFDVEVTTGCWALARGEMETATRRLLTVAGELQRRGAHDLLALPVAALARTAPVTDHTAEVLELAEGYFSAIEPLGGWAVAVRALPSTVGLLIVGDDRTGAARLAETCARECATLDAPYGAAAIAHARGLLATAGGDAASAAALLGEAANSYDRLQGPYEAAQAREAAATALATVGATEQAATAFEQALGAYRQLGASWDIARTTAAARQHGLPTPPAHRGGRRGYGSQLSPREREVALLVGRGRANKEIAAELYLAVSTVEKHLSSAMRKLNVSSRTGMVHRLHHEGDE